MTIGLAVLLSTAGGIVIGFRISKWILWGMIREGSVRIDDKGKLHLVDP